MKSQNKKNKAPHPVPLYGGVPRSGGVVRECKKVLPRCHTHSLLSLRAIADGVAIQ